MSKDQADLTGSPTISVITAAFAMERWDDLCQAVTSIAAQTASVMETIVVIDHNPGLLERARRELPGAIVVPNSRRQGASGARNSGVAASRGDVVAFLDDDAFASPSWLEVMLPHFARPGVVGVGCRIVPVWAGSRPRWLPYEFDWAVGASYRGMPAETAAVRNVWTCGMAVSREVFAAIGGFRDDFGKVGRRSRPEDTDLSLRAAAARPDGTWIYEPAAVISHQVPDGTWIYEPAAVISHHVPAERATPAFFLRRCLNEGAGKAELAALNGGSRSTSAERLYARRVLPLGVARGLRDTLRGDLSGGMRSIAITAGLGSAATGFAAGRVRSAADRAAAIVRSPAARAARSGPRILIDQSGYDLLNLGDVAMLQSCVLRLRQLWPGAEIMVICHAPGRLAAYCPGTVAIGRTLADRRLIRLLLPRRPRLAAEQAWKIAAPYLAGRSRRRRARPGRPRTAVQAVLAADLVVASGGGYLTDTWWWHGAGVLSLLSLAQRRGKPTAMFGQGIGPMDQPALRAQARSVLPGLARLGLRESVAGRDLAVALGARPGALAVTGDDALELVLRGGAADGGAPVGDALGISMRVSAYAGVDLAAARTAGEVAAEAAKAFQAPVVALPVSRYPVGSDLAALRALLDPEPAGAGVTLDDMATPEALIAAAGRCRVIVTGSYHAAVFGLAQGVPAVCLTRSRYYDAKFTGLRALFPGACFVVSLDEPGSGGRLRAAIDRAWQLPAAARVAARDAAAQQCAAGREAYARFGETVRSRTGQVTAGHLEQVR